MFHSGCLSVVAAAAPSSPSPTLGRRTVCAAASPNVSLVRLAFGPRSHLVHPVFTKRQTGSRRTPTEPRTLPHGTPYGTPDGTLATGPWRRIATPRGAFQKSLPSQLCSTYIFLSFSYTRYFRTRLPRTNEEPVLVEVRSRRVYRRGFGPRAILLGTDTSFQLQNPTATLRSEGDLLKNLEDARSSQPKCLTTQSYARLSAARTECGVCSEGLLMRIGIHIWSSEQGVTGPQPGKDRDLSTCLKEWSISAPM